MQVNSKTHKVDPNSLTPAEALVMLIFLQTEVDRHRIDIRETNKLMRQIKQKFGL